MFLDLVKKKANKQIQGWPTAECFTAISHLKEVLSLCHLNAFCSGRCKISLKQKWMFLVICQVPSSVYFITCCIKSLCSYKTEVSLNAGGWFLGCFCEEVQQVVPERKAHHHSWNTCVPSRGCLTSLSLTELLRWRRRANPGNGKDRNTSKEHFEWQLIRAGQDSRAKHLGSWRGKNQRDKTICKFRLSLQNCFCKCWSKSRGASSYKKTAWAGPHEANPYSWPTPNMLQLSGATYGSGLD